MQPNMTTYKTKTKLGKTNKAAVRVLKETFESNCNGNQSVKRGKYNILCASHILTQNSGDNIKLNSREIDRKLNRQIKLLLI